MLGCNGPDRGWDITLRDKRADFRLVYRRRAADYPL